MPKLWIPDDAGAFKVHEVPLNAGPPEEKTTTEASDWILKSAVGLLAWIATSLPSNRSDLPKRFQWFWEAEFWSDPDAMMGWGLLLALLAASLAFFAKASPTGRRLRWLPAVEGISLLLATALLGIVAVKSPSSVKPRLLVQSEPVRGELQVKQDEAFRFAPVQVERVQVAVAASPYVTVRHQIAPDGVPVQHHFPVALELSDRPIRVEPVDVRPVAFDGSQVDEVRREIRSVGTNVERARAASSVP